MNIRAQEIAKEIIRTSQSMLLVRMRFLDVAIFQLTPEETDSDKVRTVATNGEKFFSLLITTLCTYLLTMIVAFFIADLVQYIVTVAFRFENTGFATTTLLDSNYRISSMMKPFPDIMAQIITLLWIISVYLLGGMFFRRYAWLFVSLGFFILMILFAQFVMHYKSDYIIEIQENTFYIVISIVFGLLTLLNVWLSYRFFCKLQLINRKWINI